MRATHCRRLVLVAALWLAGLAPAWADTAPWWTVLHDDALQRWVELVLRHNTEVALGNLRVEAARLRLQQAEQRLRPVFTVTLGGVRDVAGSGGNADAAMGISTSAGVQYEVDPWGRGRARAQVEAFERDAAAADEQALRLRISTLAVEVYWQRQFSLEAWRQAQASLEAARQVLALVALQVRVGKVSTLEQAQARVAVEAQTLRVQALQLALRLNRLSALQLLGGPEDPPALPLSTAEGGEGPSAELPDAPPAEPMPVTRIDPPAPALPVLTPQVLAQRADLRAAASRLQSLDRERDIAAHARLPTITLSALLSRSGRTLLEAVRDPLAAVAAAMTLFDARPGEYRTARQLADNAYGQALRRYRAALFDALQEVQIAMHRRAQLQAAAGTLQRLLEHHAEIERVYALRYRLGAVELRVWIEAQDQLRSIQNDLLDNRMAQYMNHLDWIRAVGGDVPEAGQP